MSQSRLTELTWREVRRAGENGIALLPIGSQEQHAAHLPMGTDTLLVEAVVDRALALLARETPAPEVVRLPALPFGHSPHHLFAAAVSLSAQTLGAVLDDVLDSLVTSGYHRIMVVNGHGGNDEIMRLAVKRLALRAEVTAAACSYWTVTDGDPGTGREAEVTPGHMRLVRDLPHAGRPPRPGAHTGARPDPGGAPAPLRPPAAPRPDRRAPRRVGAGRRLHRRRLRRRPRPGRSRLLDGRARGLARAIHAFDQAIRSSPRTEEKI